jgi:hypothetical protein
MRRGCSDRQLHMFLVEGTHASLDSLVVFSTSSLFANELDFVAVVHAAVTSIFVLAISHATKGFHHS